MKKTSLTALLLSVAFAALTAQSALAVGTPACTEIGNTATVNYNVGTVEQTKVDSLADEFIVGNKVRPVVVTTNSAPIKVFQGAINHLLTFTVTNTGNKVQDYALAASNVDDGTAFGYENTFDAGDAIAYVESGTTTGYQAAEDALFIDGLAPDATKTVYVVVADAIPVSANNHDYSVYTLIATTHRGEEPEDSDGLGALVVNGETGSCGEATVFADLVAGTDDGDDVDDGVKDGKDSDRSGLEVLADATVQVTKFSAVYSDPINGTDSPKAIPGAVVTYTITITNPTTTEPATVTSVSISDSLDNNLAFGNLDITAGYGSINGSFKDGDGTGITTDCTGTSGQGIVVDGDCKTNLDAGDDNVDWDVTNLGTVTVTGISLAPNASTTIKFQVTIQ